MGTSTTIANQYVREVMTRPVRTITQTATIYEAAQLMKELGVGAIPVCHDRRLQGILTDRDIIIRVIAEERNPAETRVADVMTTDVTYCYENQTVDAAVRVMAGNQIRRLPIVTPEMELVGLVSLGDVAVRSDEPMAAGIALEGVSKPPRTEPPPRTDMDGSTDPQP
jgi:CBS domain-containing protein